MDFKKIRKSIARLFGWLSIIFCSLIFRIIPRSWVYAIANGLGALGYIFAVKQRKIAAESLCIAFGNDKSSQEIRKIIKDCFVSIAKGGVEVLLIVERPFLLKKMVKIIGKENLESAISKGKGAIVVSAHFGNFPLILAKLGFEGYKAAGIMRYMRDERAEKIFLGYRKKFGVKTIYTQPRRVCVEESIRSLRNNEFLFILLDQNFGTGGIFVDFFGKEAATATGPVVLAQRTGAVIIPCFMVRQSDNTHQLIFEQALNLEEGRNAQETVAINIQRLTSVIESYIRRYPAEWGWIHRRWKSKPS